jgi:hypothetical protein
MRPLLLQLVTKSALLAFYKTMLPMELHHYVNVLKLQL